MSPYTRIRETHVRFLAQNINENSPLEIRREFQTSRQSKHSSHHYMQMDGFNLITTVI